MERTKAGLWWLISLALCCTGVGCTVDFDTSAPNTFRCTRDSDCIAPNTCIKAEDAGADDPGVCARDNIIDTPPACVDEDGDGYGEGEACMGPDCDDNDKTVHPGALEICDGKDNDCDCAADARDNCALDQIDEVTECSSDADCEALADEDGEADQGMRCIEGSCYYRCPLDDVGVCGSSGPDGGGAVESCQTTMNDDGSISAQVPGCAVSGAYGPDYMLVGEDEEPCDGLDNNCNQQVDGNANCNRCGMPCSRDVGECSAGVFRCEDGQVVGCFIEGTDERATLPAEQDICNDKDDDCDGTVDNSVVDSETPASVCQDRCPFNMVLVEPAGRPGLRPFCMDRFEASRPDASATEVGQDNSRAVSRPGVLPWTNVTLSEASDACLSAGLINGSDFPQKRLCDIRELTYACGGVNDADYFYGLNYNANICNGADAGVGMLVPTGPSGEVPRDFNSCLAERGEASFYDLLGNAAEFALDNGQGKIYGGSYLSAAQALSCQASMDGQDAAPQIGFRCCYTPE